MTIRTRRETVTFRHPFRIHGIDRLLPAGSYQVIADEETIQAETVSAWRRIGTSIMLPVEGALDFKKTHKETHKKMGKQICEEMRAIHALDLADAIATDAGVAND
jgi:hypothetical protein